MAEQDKEQHLDQLLDSLLATYSDGSKRVKVATNGR